MIKHWKEIIFHILFWLSTTWLIISSFSVQSQEIEVINGIETISIQRSSDLIYQLTLCIVVSLFTFYLNAWFILTNKVPDKSKFFTFISVLVIALLSTYLVARYSIFHSIPLIPKHIAFGIVIFYFAISVSYSLIKKTIRDKDYLQKLLIEKKQTELNMLRNQLQPHFLFNALNNLMSLANSSKNVKLVNSFDKLSQLLRFVIEDNQTEKIAIDKEILFLKNYIDLQLLRFEEEEVQIQFKIIGKYNTQKVEPGLFIPFVENAFKYGTEPERTAVVEIEFDLTNEKEVQFKIKNKILIASKNNFGTGIETTRKRLELIYPNRHKLAITETKDFIVQLYINTQ